VSLAGRTVVVTGATSGLGRVAAERLARLGARVVLVGRDAAKLARAHGEIRSATGNGDLGVEVADLSVLSAVRALADRLLANERQVHVLVNNAGVLENERRTTAEGLEVSLATNLLAPFALTRALLPRLRESAPSRIVNVLSGGMYFAGLGPAVFGEDGAAWNGDLAYARHKRALMALTETWAGELAADGVVANAMHPGWAETPGVARSLPLFLRLTKPFLRTPEEGADTIVWLAAAPEAAGVSGALWLDREPHPAAVLPGTAGTDEQRRWLLEELTRRTKAPANSPPRPSGDASAIRRPPPPAGVPRGARARRPGEGVGQYGSTSSPGTRRNDSSG
jgi:NAD(P)-dependent dehydrogenase (short-subunit alcohol dehydrogenase family)